MNQPAPTPNPKIDLADVLQRFSSKVLWHFTGYNKSWDDAFRIQNEILQSNLLQVGKQSETIVMNSGQKRYGYSVACMCDIPFRDLRIHMVRYGLFGIAFFKHAAINTGNFNPVFYVHYENPLFKRAEDLFKVIDPAIKEDSAFNKSLNEYLRMIGSYVKRGDLNRIVEVNSEIDSSQSSNFYYEREWRTVFPWKFDDASVAAIMMPQRFLADFQKRWGHRFVNSSIISSEMIETL
jgi:hypothetical protein